MNKEENRDFIRKIESLVKPEDVTTISFLGDYNKLLPKKTQHKIMTRGSRKIPYMGFIVDPYCLFLTYKIKNIAAVEAMLPEGYELEEASLFKNEPKCPLLIFSAFSARTSAFIGMRLEVYIIARVKNTGLLSWIISDYETNTNSHDPKNGFCGYTGDPAVFTTTPFGELIIDVKNRLNGREFSITADIRSGNYRELDESLWLEGNFSVNYGGELRNPSSKPFGLIFDPVIMKKALQVPIDSMEIRKNTYQESIIDCDRPVSAAVFPYSQHFIIRQDLKSDELLNESDLNREISTFLERNDFKTMSGNDIKKPLYAGIFFFSLVNWGIILFLLIKLFI